jgi:hypothetical protein
MLLFLYVLLVPLACLFSIISFRVFVVFMRYARPTVITVLVSNSVFLYMVG